jgi:NAD(P)-dependent dehydrogenase (short-subunit alcohol dehydrogenase family)
LRVLLRLVVFAPAEEGFARPGDHASPCLRCRLRSSRRIAQTPAGRTDRFARNPLKRIGQHEEVAAVILGLATTMTFVNGTIIPVDGGSLF